jgi:superfamily II DNA/RNA helicase
VFNFDTPWHPDDYVHRIGRTGRAGAKGRAFTFVTPEDAEAIANVEKLTGMQIPVHALGGREAEERPAEKPRRESRERKADRPRREDRSDEPRRESRVDEPRKPARRSESGKEPPREPILEEAGEPGEWHGPVPSFLNLSAL